MYSGASGAADILLHYYDISNILKDSGIENNQGDYPEILWKLIWDDGLGVEIGAHTKHYDLEEEDDPFEALRENEDDWTVWLPNQFEDRFSEIIKRLWGIFGKSAVKYYGTRVVEASMYYLKCPSCGHEAIEEEFNESEETLDPEVHGDDNIVICPECTYPFDKELGDPFSVN
jgi:hypothetical protein